MVLENIIIEKKYFDQILEGKKKEEYRSFNDYYIKKLCILTDKNEIDGIKSFTQIQLCNGYRKDRRVMIVEVKGIFIDTFENFIPEEFQKGDQTFTIELGKVIEKNF